MSGSVNKVILIGNLGADPEVRTFPSGGKVCSLRVATSENWKDRTTGERRERTEWHTVQILNEGLIRVAEQYLRKGSKVYLEGMLKTRKWKDQSGSDRFATEVILQGFDSTMTMLDPGDGAGATGATGASRSGGSNGYGQSGGYGSGQREGSSGYGQQGGGDTGGYGGGNHGPYGNQAPDRDALNRKLNDEIPF